MVLRTIRWRQVHGMRNLLKRIVLEVLSWACQNESPKVVYYHDVGRRYTDMGTPTELFWAHMDSLRAGDVVCFDDGFRGIWDERERFAQTSVKPIVFLAVDLIGKTNYLNWDEIRELQRRGFRFEGHSWSHCDLTTFDDTALWHEVYDSKVALSRGLGKEVDEICFPIGYFSDRVLVACRKAGYRKMYVSYPGIIDPVADIVPRHLVQDLSVSAFRAVLRGGMLPLAGRYRRRHFRTSIEERTVS